MKNLMRNVGAYCNTPLQHEKKLLPGASAIFHFGQFVKDLVVK